MSLNRLPAPRFSRLLWRILRPHNIGQWSCESTVGLALGVDDVVDVVSTALDIPDHLRHVVNAVAGRVLVHRAKLGNLVKRDVCNFRDDRAGLVHSILRAAEYFAVFHGDLHG